MPYHLLDHTSELSLQVTGHSLPDLFSDALEGTMHILKHQSLKATKPIIRNIKLTAPDITTLLIDFLNETLYLAQTHKEIYPQITFVKLESTQLQATLKGLPVKSFDDDIKAVTYHQAHVHQNQAGEWQTKIVYDI